MPQLDPSTYPSQIFWLVVTFALLYALMVRFALPAVAGVLQNRKERIAGDLDKAEELSVEARTLEASYLAELETLKAEAQAVTSKALSSAKQHAEEKHAELDKVLLKRLKTAEGKIEKASQAALADIAGVATDLAAHITKELTGASVDKKTARKAVDSVIK